MNTNAIVTWRDDIQSPCDEYDICFIVDSVMILIECGELCAQKVILNVLVPWQVNMERV